MTLLLPKVMYGSTYPNIQESPQKYPLDYIFLQPYRFFSDWERKNFAW